MNVIECNNVSKRYGSKPVLDAINLHVPQCGFFGLVGMNGSGKSTLIKCILDLIAFEGGTIQIQGRAHKAVNARANVAYLPDRFSPPLHLKCRDFIQYMLELHATEINLDRIHAMLDALQLDRATMNSSVGRLSKGMTQKLGIASCLLSGKKLLILDEPMSGLDPKARVLLKQQLFKLKEAGTSVFFSSHALADVDEMADRMAVLHNGQVRFEGGPQVFKRQYSADTLEQAYMNCVEQNGQ
jgi:ABC-2 type transport system ATP-binding protein